MLLSTGERISCALCAMAINDLGHRAISLTGSQAGIVTDESHTKARIIDVRADRILRGPRRGPHRARGGLSGRLHLLAATSPRSGAAARTRRAVALAAALGAEVCEIYTDVAGVYTADPRIVPDARKLRDGLLRGDARDGRLGSGRAAAALGRVRPQPRRAHPLPLLVRGLSPVRLCSRKETATWSSP